MIEQTRTSSPFPASARHQRLVAALHGRAEVSVGVLAATLRVSTMTVRRDLQQLARAGRIIRTHGGALAAPRVSFEFRFLERTQLRHQAKQAIGRAAARLVRDGQSVILDSGSTTLAVTEQLQARQGLTVITTSLPIAAALFGSGNAEVLLLGGFLRRDTPDLAGPVTEGNLETLRADIAFIGADGIDARGRVYNASVQVARMLGKMAAAAAQVYVVADACKIGRTALMRFADLTKLTGLITDAAIPATQLRKLRRAGIRVIVAH
jgi:DeoR/GlpR family transcriptional regulator of sugar metabolism